MPAVPPDNVVLVAAKATTSSAFGELLSKAEPLRKQKCNQVSVKFKQIDDWNSSSHPVVKPTQLYSKQKTDESCN